MSAADQIGAQEALALLSQSPGSTGTSPPASPLAPVNAAQGFYVQADGAGGYVAPPTGQTYMSAIVDPRYLADSQGNLYRPTDASDFSPEEARATLGANPVNPWVDAASSILPGVAKGAAGFAGLPGDLLNLGRAGGDALWKQFGGNPADIAKFDRQAQASQMIPDPPTSGDINSVIQGVTGPYYQPQTAWGRATGTVGEMGMGAAFPGSLAARALRVLVPAAATDAAGEAARAFDPGNPQAEGYARMAGGFLGAGTQGIGEGIANLPGRMLSRAAPNLTQEQVSDALSRIQAGQNLPNGGISLTPYEAGAASGQPGLSDLLDFVESTPQGRARMAPFFAARPAQVAATTNGMADALAPPRPDPSMLGVRAQRAGQGVIGNAEAQRLKLADAAGYTAADPQSIDTGAIADVLDRINAGIAGDQTGLLTPQLAKLRNSLTATPESPGSAAVPPQRVQTGTHFSFEGGSPAVPPSGAVPITNIGQLSTARNYWKGVIDNTPPERMPGPLATVLSGHIGDVDAALKANPSYQAGNDAYAAASRDIVNPLTAGPVGTIAGTPDFPTMSTALFQPRNVGGAPETSQALQLIGGQDPSLPPQIVSQYLRNMAFSPNGALRDLNGGPNEWGGAGLARRLAGTPDTRDALLSATDIAGGAPEQMADYLDTMGATGKRLPTGSRTAARANYNDAMGFPHFQRSYLDPMEIFSAMAQSAKGAIYHNTINKLADFGVNQDAPGLVNFLGQARGVSGNPGLANALLSARAGASSP